jgi:hypothetical protein
MGLDLAVKTKYSAIDPWGFALCRKRSTADSDGWKVNSEYGLAFRRARKKLLAPEFLIDVDSLKKEEEEEEEEEDCSNRKGHR